MGLAKFIGTSPLDNIEWQPENHEDLIFHLPRHGRKIRYGASLTVYTGQMALCVIDEQITDIFTEGSYTLTQDSLPLVARHQQWGQDHHQDIDIELYIISSHYTSEHQWSTEQPVLLNDVRFGLVRLGASGRYHLRIADPRHFVERFLHTHQPIDMDVAATDMSRHAASLFPEVTLDSNISVLELSTRYQELAENLKHQLLFACQQYGLVIEHLCIDSISLPEKVQRSLVPTETDDTDRGEHPADTDKPFNEPQIVNTGAETLNNDSREINNPKDDAGSSSTSGQHELPFTFHTQAPNDTQPASQQVPATVVEQPPYYYMLLGERHGPVSLAFLQEKLRTEELEDDTMVWKKGMSAWQPLQDIIT